MYIEEATDIHIRDIVADFVSENNFSDGGTYTISVFVQHYAGRETELANGEIHYKKTLAFNSVIDCEVRCHEAYHTGRVYVPITEVIIALLKDSEVVNRKIYTITNGERQ